MLLGMAFRRPVCRRTHFSPGLHIRLTGLNGELVARMLRQTLALPTDAQGIEAGGRRFSTAQQACPAAARGGQAG